MSAIRHSLLTAALVATLAVAAGGIAGCATEDPATGAAEEYPTRALQIIAPAAPGGGWDQTARTLQTVIEESGLTDRGVEVRNVAGAGGTVGLDEFSAERSEHVLMVMGLVMVGAVLTNDPAATLDDVTPIAKLTSEYEVLVVPAASPYTTLAEFVEAWREDPGALAIAGGSAGGTDQILAGLAAQAVGIDPREINYVPFSGGGESLAALLGNQVAAGISGVGEYAEQVEAGRLRALAVSSPERIPALDAPTFREGGVDVELANWRGIVAPKSVTPEQRDAILAFVERVHATEGWRKAVVTNGWDDSYVAGDAFGEELAAERTRIEGVLRGIGLV